MQMQNRVAPSVNCCTAIKMAFKNMLNCNGRSRRSEFWWLNLFLGILMTILSFIIFILFIIIFAFNFGSRYNRFFNKWNNTLIICNNFNISDSIINIYF